MNTHAVTLELPDPLYQAARQVAAMTGQTLEAVLRFGIAHTLPPLDDVPSEQAVELSALALLDDAALWKVAQGMMSAEEQTELDELLSCQEAGELNEAERERLHALMDVYGHSTLRKAHAYLLLARRGYHVPMQN